MSSYDIVLRNRFSGKEMVVDLQDFLIDPRVETDNAAENIEAIQYRTKRTLGRLLAKLIERDVLSLDDVLEVCDIQWDKGHSFEVREVNE